MGIFYKSFAALAVTLTLAAGSAGATTFAFGGARADLGINDLPLPSMDGIDLTVRSSGGNIHRNNAGFGVVGNPGGNRMSGAETLTFEFSPDVNIIESIIFERLDGTDDIEIRDGSNGLLASFTVGNGNANGSLVTVSLSNVAGSSFTFRRTGGTGTEGVRIRSLTVAAIPLPATLPLLAFAFGGLAFAARRRNKKAA